MKTTVKNNSIRRALLAKVHIARKELGIPEEDYRDILFGEFGVRSAKDLAMRELGQLVERFESKGWRPRVNVQCPMSNVQCPSKKDKPKSQADALKERVGQMLLHTDFDESRLRGLVRKICGVEDLRWAGDAVRLKRLIAVIGDMLDRGDIRTAEHAERAET